jgi:hypothetical protein
LEASHLFKNVFIIPASQLRKGFLYFWRGNLLLHPKKLFRLQSLLHLRQSLLLVFFIAQTIVIFLKFVDTLGQWHHLRSKKILGGPLIETTGPSQQWTAARMLQLG